MGDRAMAHNYAGFPGGANSRASLPPEALGGWDTPDHRYSGACPAVMSERSECPSWRTLHTSHARHLGSHM